MTSSLLPLKNSWAATQLEADLRDMFVQLFEDALREQCDEINCYGAPHLGDLNLIARHVTQDGLALLRDDDEVKMRYIFKAFRYLNPERGLHMLRTYVRVLFGNAQEVNQLWQKKADAYPNTLKSFSQIAGAGEDEDDYFLTSRIRVDLDTDTVPERITRALRTVIAARMLLDIRISKFAMNQVGIAGRSNAAVLCDATGTAGRYTQYYNGAWTFNGDQEYDGVLNT